MEYIEINEQCEKWRGTWQDSKFMADLNERQRERDFREGYMRGFEMATKAAEKVTRLEVIQHSPPIQRKSLYKLCRQRCRNSISRWGKNTKSIL